MNYYALLNSFSTIFCVSLIMSLVIGFRNKIMFLFAVFSLIALIVLIYLRRFENASSGFWYTADAERSRRVALRIASMYLAPYDNIWNNLKLSNQHCTLRLGKDGLTLTGMEKKTELYRIFKAAVPMQQDDIWNRFCLNFRAGTTYNMLLDYCNMYQLRFSECTIPNKTSSSNAADNVADADIKQLCTEKTDINNCSEIELTTLPGISIVISKKIIKKREEIRGFKDVDEFFDYMKFKPHIEKQLKNLVCINKMQGARKIQKYKERNLDL